MAYRKSERTKKAIEDKFLELIKEHNICDIKVRQITDSLGIDRSTFYAHYNSVYDLAETIEDRLISSVLHPTPGSVMLQVLHILQEDKEAYLTLHNYTHNEPSFMPKAHNKVKAIIKPLLENLDIHADDAELSMYYAFIFEGQYGLTKWFLEREDAYTAEEIAAIIDQLSVSTLTELHRLTSEIQEKRSQHFMS